jgi:pyruvate dehydrogenase E1 component beta subunit
MSGETSTSRKMFFNEAIARALAEEMARDPRIMLLGQDIGSFGGPYKEFSGLFERFGPGRVRDMPVAEAAMTGLAVGAAASGLRPLINITYMDFLMLGLDPLVNYGAKAKFKSGGQIRIPLVIKTTAGAKGQGVAHSQCLEAWLMSVPGLKVVAPSTPADAYGLMKSALREEGPVVFIDHKRLFPVAGEVPVAETLTPLGEALLRRPGADVTIVSHSWMTRAALQAATSLAGEGLSAEVIELRSLAPLDIETISASVTRTAALVTVEEGQLTCGVGAEIIARLQERGTSMAAARVGALPAPVSSNPVLEAACLPSAERIASAVRGLLSPHPSSTEEDRHDILTQITHGN